MKLGFIGVGRMGSHMARHLAEGGHEVRVYDTFPAAVERLLSIDNITAAKTYRDVASEAEVVFASLPGPAEVEDIVLSEGGLEAVMMPGAVFVDMSTNSPSLVRRLPPLLAQKGISMLDAPVSGGVEGAEAGTLAIMVGGEREVFDRVEPLFSLMGKKIVYCGEAGAGNVTKLCNNIAAASYGMILAEALTLGVKAGVDLETLASSLGASTASSPRLNVHFPAYLFKGNFKPGFSIGLSTKDTRLALELGEEYNVPLPIATRLRDELAAATAHGWLDDDMDAIARLQEERAGVELRLPGF